MNSEVSGFDFPNKLRVGMKFSSISSINQYLKEEARQLGMPNWLFHKRDFYPSAKNWKTLRYRCAKCATPIWFAKRGINLVAQVVRAHHNHPPTTKNFRKKTGERRMEKRESQRPRSLKKRGRRTRKPMTPAKSDTKDLRKTSYQVKKVQQVVEISDSEPIKEQIVNASEQEMERPTLKEQCWLLEQQLKQRGYTAKTEIITERSHKYSKLVVAFSEPMLKAYARFGDLLYFDVFDGLVEEVRHTKTVAYKVGLFSVADSSSSCRIIGATVFRELTAKTVGQVLKTLFELQGKEPSTIVTNEINPEVKDGIALLVDQGLYKGRHFYYPQKQLETAWRGLKGGSSEIAEGVLLIKKAIKCRDLDQFSSILKALFSNKTRKEVVDGLMSQPHSALFCCCSEAFVGLGIWESSQLANCISASFPKDNSILNMFVELEKLEASLKLAAVNAYKRYPEDIGMQFSSPRLAVVRGVCDEKVTKRFIQNYVAGATKWTVKEPLPGDTGIVKVVSRTAQVEYRIKGKQCECREFERTGVACPHLILLASSNNNQSYTELIKERWKREANSNSP